MKAMKIWLPMLAAAVMSPAACQETQVQLGTFVNDVVDSDEVWIVRFTSNTRKPWAPVCKKLTPAWEELTKSMKRIKTATIDVTDRNSEEAKLATNFGVFSEGLPNLKLFLTKSDSPTSLLASESADLKKLKKRLARHVKKLEKDKETGLFLKNPPRSVKVLDNNNFDSELAIATADESKTLFVKFYRPQCAHCKALAPVWEALGEELQAEGKTSIIMGEVNCDAHDKACAKQGVSSHPTLIKYTKSMMQDEFPGEVFGLKNEHDEMKQFVVDPEGYKAKLADIIKKENEEKAAKKAAKKAKQEKKEL